MGGARLEEWGVDSLKPEISPEDIELILVRFGRFKSYLPSPLTDDGNQIYDTYAMARRIARLESALNEILSLVETLSHRPEINWIKHTVGQLAHNGLDTF